jgi:hypothetical protein
MVYFISKDRMMNYTQVTSLSYANAEGTAINCWVAFDDFDEPLPFTASANDTEAHGREIFARAVAGEFGGVAPYVPPEPA